MVTTEDFTTQILEMIHYISQHAECVYRVTVDDFIRGVSQLDGDIIIIPFAHGSNTSLKIDFSDHADHITLTMLNGLGDIVMPRKLLFVCYACHSGELMSRITATNIYSIYPKKCGRTTTSDAYPDADIGELKESLVRTNKDDLYLNIMTIVLLRAEK